MGDRLRRYYDYAGTKGGFTLQLKLAMRTLLSRNRAADAPDSEENLELFRTALAELLPGEKDIPKY